jgi:HAE1 family hydrophobic/amphiphilic exporter-1
MIRFLIDRPIFSGVIAIIIVIMGVVAITQLPISRYPPIAPPQVEVRSNFIGAGARPVADAVTTPLEQAINGVDGMIYLSSNSTSDGASTVRVTFEVGYDVDIAAVDTLNRVNSAEALLPEAVRDLGVTVRKTSPQLTAVISVFSPNGTYDQVYLSNYADINLIDPINRIQGVGSTANFGARNYAIRVWLDPDRMAHLGLMPGDVISAIRAQNVEVASGAIAEPPVETDRAFQYEVRAPGRLQLAEEFGDIVVRRSEDGAVLRIRDIARVELGAASYGSSAQLSGQPSAQVGIFQAPGANALELIAEIRATLEELSATFPEDLDYQITFDTAGFVEQSIYEVVITLLIAAALVIGVIYLFLQTVRATLIPMIAIPVSLIGTFAVLLALGFSINTLSLLGMVLAVGLVVDDAIVVVENVERNLRHNPDANAAAKQAMREVTGPIVATTLVLFALFVPIAFLPGITGQLYRQFTLTIAVAVGFSSIVSLSLSPALCSLLLRQKAEKQAFVFRTFNRGFDRLIAGLRRAVAWLGRVWLLVVGAFLAVLAGAVLLILTLPGGFVPQEDQGYFFVNAELPPAAALDRTEDVIAEMQEILLEMPEVEDVVGVAGFSLVSQTNASYVGLGVAVLKPWGERDRSSFELVNLAQQRLSERIADARIQVINPPAVPGISSVGGLELFIQDRGNQGIEALQQVVNAFVGAGIGRPEFQLLFTPFSASVPQIDISVDEDKARRFGVAPEALNEVLQSYLGSVFVNEFNRFGQTFRVFVQAESVARDAMRDIAALNVMNREGERVPLGTLVEADYVTGADNIPHYNLFTAASVTAIPAVGVSGGEAVAAVEALAADVLPTEFGYEWTGTVFQQQQIGNLTPVVFGLAFLFVFLVLAAQYESWIIPIVIVLSVPFAMLGALGFLALRGVEVNVFAQIGMVMLIGLAAKNAILIVAFAKDRREQGAGIAEAAIDAAGIRLRPVMMTALSFIMGTMPLVIATGAGANARMTLGTTVVGGMVLATTLTLLFTPVFFMLFERLRDRRDRRRGRGEAAGGDKDEARPAGEAPSAGQGKTAE